MSRKYKLNSQQIAEIIHSCTSRIPRPDGSLVELWCDLTDIQKEHAAQAVREIYSVPKKTPQELHDLWAKPLIANNWVQGEYSWENKQHPCLVPFEELPDSEVLKDYLWSHMTDAFREFYDDDESGDII